MKYRGIPKTGLSVSEIGFGVWTLANAHRSGLVQEDPLHLLKYARDRGINFFETADVFGLGYGEELLGRAFYDERERVVLATRFGYRLEENKGQWGAAQRPEFTPKLIKRACEKSLRRLKTDRIDIYQIHHPNISTVERDDIYALLEKLKKQGKICSWGASLTSNQEWVEEAKLMINLRQTSSLQVYYDLLEPEPALELMSEAERQGTRLFACLSKSYDFKKEEFKKDFSFLNGVSGRTLFESLCKFSLFESVVASVVIDIYSEKQVNELAFISERPELTPEEMIQIQNIHDCARQKKNDESVALTSFPIDNDKSYR